MIVPTLLMDSEAVEARLWELPHRPGGQVVAGVLDGGFTASFMGTTSRGGFREERGFAVSMWGWFVGDGWDSGIIVHVTNEFELGGGMSPRGAQFQGTLATALMGGWRFDVGKNHGPFVRGGMDLRFIGNDILYRSLWELPRVDAGWQYVVGKQTAFDVALSTGLGLLGRHDLGAAERILDISWVSGATGSIIFGPLRLLTTWTHIIPQGAGGHVDWLDGAVCGSLKGIAVCSRVAYQIGDVINRSNVVAPAHATEVGITLGFKQKFK